MIPYFEGIYKRKDFGAFFTSFGQKNSKPLRKMKSQKKYLFFA